MKKLPALIAVSFLAACGSSAPSGGNGSDSTGGKASSSGGKGGSSSSTGGATAGSGGSAGSGAGGSVAGGSGGAGAGSGGAAGSPTSTGGAGGSDTGGSAGSGAPPAAGYKFGAHPQMYPAGSIKPTGDQGALDTAVKAAYDKWKAAYVMAGCEGYIVKTGGTEITTSSALSAGMLLTAMMAGHDPEAQTVFDGLFAVGRKFPSILGITVPAKHGIGPRDNNTSLPAYGVGTGCKAVPEGDSAVDGDLEFAYALIVADKQWGSAGKVNYLDESKKTMKAIQSYDMSPLKTPLIGDWASLPGEGMWTTVTKPPHFMVGHFRAFAKASADMYWMQVAEAVQSLITESQTKYSPMTGLFPRYLIGSKTLPGNNVLGGDDGNSRDYFGESGYIPLRLSADYIGSADPRSKTAAGKINEWIKTATGGDPAKIVDGYTLAGAPIGTKGTMAFVAPFAAAAIVDVANQAWLDAIWKLMVEAPISSERADSANVLAMLIVTGNWWQP